MLKAKEIRVLYLYGDLIETYWDVKGFSKKKEVAAALDLIETYWDVKVEIKIHELKGRRDLIETYWDVKP